MDRLLYLGLLAACLIGTAPLELVLRVGVYRQWRRLAATIVPVLTLFGGWDIVAVAQHLWTYDRR